MGGGRGRETLPLVGLFEVLEVWRVCFKASTRLEARGLGGFVRCEFRERGPFFSKVMTKALRKYGNAIQNACEKANNDKQAFPKGPRAGSTFSENAGKS